MEECRRLARRILCAAAVLAGSAFGARGQDAVLLSSTAPGQAPGMVIADGRSFAVPDGAIAILLLRSGEVLKIAGPSRGLPKAPMPRSGFSAFLSELSRAQTTDEVTAATRGGPSRIDGASVGEAVVVDVDHSATYCIDGSSALRLRRVGAADWPRGVRRLDGSRVIVWQASEPELRWPTDLGMADGERLEVLDGAGAGRAILTFRRLSVLQSESAWTAQAVLLGCSTQASAKLQELARTVTTPALYLASDRGRNPTYRIGEPLKIVIQSNVDGYLYCFLRQGDGSTVPIFPARAADGARLEAHVPLWIPGRRLAAELRAAAPRGTNEIHCYLAGRNLHSELPSAMLDQDFTPLPNDAARSLEKVFGTTKGARIAAASLFLKVEANGR